MKKLEYWRKQIKKSAKTANGNSHSRDLISICLRVMTDHYGKEETNKAIEDFDLEKLGWSKRK